MARALRGLLDATHAFLDYYALNTFAERRHRVADDDWRDVGWTGGEAEDLEGDQRATWSERVRTLGVLADNIEASYDAFIDLARRRRLLEIG